MDADGFVSVHRAAFDLLLAQPQVGTLGIAAALGLVRDWERDNNIPGPTVYGSTAITSAGFVPPHPTPDQFSAGKARNELLAARLYSGLLDSGLVVTEVDVMMPTELGHVPGWPDSTYLAFYFAYASGISTASAALLEADLERRYADDDPRPIADARPLSNDERRPSYVRVTRTIMAALDAIRLDPTAVDHPPMTVLLRLVDVSRSLGCSAELEFAIHEGLHLLAPMIDESAVAGTPLGQDLADLRALGGTCGVPFSPVSPVAVLPPDDASV